MNPTFASIVPLIGGETIAMQQALGGQRPEYLLSYSAFSANDKQIVEYYKNEVPYILLDSGGSAPKPVNIVNATCPCAGLSTLSPSSSADNAANNWMLESAKHVLSVVKPDCFWGENAPALATNAGKPVVAKLRQIAERNGYTMSLYQTKSLLHGLAQVRNRSFYFFWKGNRVPFFDYHEIPHEKIEDTIRNVERRKDDPMNVLVREDKPTDNPFYQFVLEQIHNNELDHQAFQRQLVKTVNPMTYLEDQGVKYDEVGKWMKAHGHDKLADRCDIIFHKLASGKNIMRKIVEIPKDYIGAFVGHMPHSLAHPDEDRYLTYRECLSIMKMPEDFMLENPKRNLNMVCQNVPVTTAYDMANQVLRACEDDDVEWIEAPFINQNNKNHTYVIEKEPATLTQFM